MSNSTFFTDLHVPFDLRLNEDDEPSSASKRNNEVDDDEGWDSAVGSNDQISVSGIKAIYPFINDII